LHDQLAQNIRSS